ncbi:MAG: flagellar biosynthesis protein FlhF [Gammaproteobacteria bacterium]|nr:MAG: flagellar biosynthesis protein FlhF [Gammaproteobacteria bacterium]
MRIKRYYGSTIREAIRKVREEQGPDALILSNRVVDNGVELIAAADYDEILLDEIPRVATRDTTPAATPGNAPPKSAKPAPVTAAPRAVPASVADRTGTPDISPDRQTNLSRYLRGKTRPVTAAPGVVERRVIKPAKPAVSEIRKPEAPTAARTEANSSSMIERMNTEIRTMRRLIEQQLSGLIWGDIARRSPVKSYLLRLLLKLELSPTLCRDVVAAIPDTDDTQRAWRNALAVLANKIPIADDEILAAGGVCALIGPTGVGKTTTIAKLAARFCVRHGASQAALITTDNYRIGAHEQLRTFAKLLNVPMRVAASPAELRNALAELSGRRLVLIDTAGIGQRDARLAEQFSMLRGGPATIRNYLVLSSTTRGNCIREIIRRYQEIPLRAAILTKVDEAGSLGGILSQLIRSELPIAYIADGQRVPEDLSVALAHRLIARSVAMMQREVDDKEDESMNKILEKVVANV